MFRQMKVDLVGMVENMSYFVCPHCNHEIDIFSRGGRKRPHCQFRFSFRSGASLTPTFAKRGTAVPTVLDGEGSPHAKALFDFAARWKHV